MKELLAILIMVSAASSASEATLNTPQTEQTMNVLIYRDELENSTYEKIDVELIEQFPELPTGCEVTSLTMVLNYLGYPVEKTELADDFLTKAPLGEIYFSEAFMGDPRLETGFGCFSPVIVECAEKYIESVGGTHTVTDITGSTPDELYEQIFLGNPVIVWATGDLKEPVETDVWTRKAQVKWLMGEHCFVLIGYDKSNNLVIVADPLKKEIVEYDKELFELRYTQLGSQAVIIT